MKKRLFFWTSWPVDEQRVITFFGSATVLALLVAVGALIAYPWPALSWEPNLQDLPLETSFHRVGAGPYSLEVKADSFIVWESFSGSSFRVLPIPYLFFGLLVTLGIIVILALHSSVRRFNFLVGTGFLFFIASGLRLETLFPSLPNFSATILVFLVWLTPGLLFQYKFPTVGFSKRLFIYGIIVTITYALIAATAQAPAAWIYLSVGLLPTALLTIPVFLILTAHEIPAALIAVIGMAGKERNGFRDFLILTGIYLINLFAIYLSDLKWFEWSYGIHPVVLALISGVLGIAGIRYQQKQLGDFLNTEPYGVYLMMALSLISFSGIGFFYLTGNDALFSTLRDLSLYIHIGYGFVFVTYIVSNFSSLLVEGINISKVIYQPTVMPFFTYRFGGLVATLAFVFYNIWQRPINDAIGGYYNALAGYHQLAGEKTLSDGYLRIASRYAYHNHQSNVLLAESALAEGQADRAKVFFQNALERRPTEQTYLSLINLLEINGKSLESFTYLKNGLNRFPDSPYLLNALGLSNYGLGSMDSSVWYFREAGAQGGKAGRSARINETALVVREGTINNVDSLYQSFDESALAARANALAAANRKGQILEAPLMLPSDSIFQQGYATWLNNWLINQKGKVSEESIRQLTPYIQHSGNRDYAEALHFSLALAAYHSGLLNAAIESLEKAIFIGENKGRYNTIIAVWMLEQRAPETALQYSDYAIQQEFKDAALTRAVVLAEVGRLGESIVAWDTLGKKDKGTIQFLANLSKRSLGVNVSFFDDLSDEERYTYCRYRLKNSDSVLFRTLIKKIANSDLRARAIYDRAEKLFEADRMNEAIRVYRELDGVEISNDRLFHSIQLLELRMLAESGQYELLQQRLKNNFMFQPQEIGFQKYFHAVLSLPDTSQAGPAYRWIERNNLYCTDGILSAAGFKSNQQKNDLAAYSLLASALHRNPYSVRLLKGYIRSASGLGLLNFASDAISDLQNRIEPAEFNLFMSALPPATNQP
ncbi:MAG: hypothetical protein ACO263_00095 [Cyclobacteriaceae bacterium]